MALQASSARAAPSLGFPPLTESCRHGGRALTWSLSGFSRRGVYRGDVFILAEGEGFEPSRPFQDVRFSRPLVSTAHATLRTMEPHSGFEPDCPLYRRGASPEMLMRRDSFCFVVPLDGI